MGDNDIYYVEKIIDRRKVNDRYEYKIKWEGYPMNQSTWEPLENLRTAMELVDEYNNEHPFPKKLIGKKKNRTKKEEAKESPEKKENPIQQVQEKKEEIEQPKEELDQNKNINLDENKPIYAINNQMQEDNVRKYIVDNTLEKVSTVRKRDNKLMAVVKKKKSNGEYEEVEIETFKLRNENPWILLDFYESKIKFT